MIPFYIFAIVVPLFGILGFFAGVYAGVYQERTQWNKLIHVGAIPKPPYKPERRAPKRPDLVQPWR